MTTEASANEWLIQHRPQPGVLQLTLNRPRVHNALNFELLRALRDAITAAESDGEVRIVVLRGEGKSFCAGLDLKTAADADQAAEATELLSQTLLAIRSSRLIFVCTAHGAAFGGGAALLLASDIAVADTTLKIGLPEVKRGIVPAMVGVLLREQLGGSATKRILLLGQTLEAEKAERLGLVTAVVKPEAIDDQVTTTTKQLLLAGPATLAATKQLLTDASGLDFGKAWALAHEAHLRARVSPEFDEGSAAFREKRPPSWAAGLDQ